MRILDHTAGFLFAPLWSIGAQIELLENDPLEQDIAADVQKYGAEEAARRTAGRKARLAALK
jgi:hypothetical protein